MSTKKKSFDFKLFGEKETRETKAVGGVDLEIEIELPLDDIFDSISVFEEESTYKVDKDTIKNPPLNPIRILMLECQRRAPNVVWTLKPPRTAVGVFDGASHFTVKCEVVNFQPFWIEMMVYLPHVTLHSRGDIDMAWKEMVKQLKATTNDTSICHFFMSRVI